MISAFLGGMQRMIRHVCLAKALLVAMAIFFTGACAADALTDKVVATFRALDPDLKVSAKSDDELELTGRGDPLNAYLDNLRKACDTHPETCDDEVKSYTEHMRAVASEDRSADGTFASEKVFAVLRSAGYAQHSAEMIQDADKKLVELPFVDGTELLFVVDGETAMRYVNRSDLSKAGLDEQGLLALAQRNVTRLPEPPFEELKGMPGVFAMLAHDGLGTSRTFDASLMKKLEAAAGGPIAISTPTRDWLLFTRADKPEQVTALKTLAQRIVRGESYAVSPAVFVKAPNGWKAL